MKRKIKLPKERNAVVVQLIKRAGSGSGVHSKTKKAQRRFDKVQMKKELCW